MECVESGRRREDVAPVHWRVHQAGVHRWRPGLSTELQRPVRPDVASLRVRLGQLTRLDLHQLDCSLVGCSLPHPAPRQTASLRAVAYPLVQEARRWPPPSLRLVWPVRLSVVVTWRRDPTSGCFGRLSLQRCHLPVPPSLHGVSWAQFPRFGGTMRHSDSSPPIPPRFVAFARRYHPSTCGSLRRTPGATSTASGLVSRCPRPGGL